MEVKNKSLGKGTSFFSDSEPMGNFMSGGTKETQSQIVLGREPISSSLITNKNDAPHVKEGEMVSVWQEIPQQASSSNNN